MPLYFQMDQSVLLILWHSVTMAPALFSLSQFADINDVDARCICTKIYCFKPTSKRNTIIFPLKHVCVWLCVEGLCDFMLIVLLNYIKVVCAAVAENRPICLFFWFFSRFCFCCPTIFPPVQNHPKCLLPCMIAPSEI